MGRCFHVRSATKKLHELPYVEGKRAMAYCALPDGAECWKRKNTGVIDEKCFK